MAKLPQSDGVFSTSDTVLAAWLVSQGYELLDLDNSKPNSVAFLFTNDSEAFSNTVKAFQLGTAEGNIMAFYRAYKRLLSKIKEDRLSSPNRLK